MITKDQVRRALEESYRPHIDSVAALLAMFLNTFQEFADCNTSETFRDSCFGRGEWADPAKSLEMRNAAQTRAFQVRALRALLSPEAFAEYATLAQRLTHGQVAAMVAFMEERSPKMADDFSGFCSKAASTDNLSRFATTYSEKASALAGDFVEECA
jgi:hypothetical protein